MTTKRSRVEAQNGDKAIALYHVVYAKETFEDAAQVLFQLVRDAEKRYPGQRRILFLDIEGHRNNAGGFDRDMAELQTEFLTGFLMSFVSEAHIPLLSIGTPAPTNAKPNRRRIQYMQNPNQRNDLPDVFHITPADDGKPGGGSVTETAIPQP